MAAQGGRMSKHPTTIRDFLGLPIRLRDELGQACAPIAQFYATDNSQNVVDNYQLSVVFHRLTTA